MTVPRLILSIFPGADLLGRGFETEGWYVVRGHDLLYGSRIEDEHPPAGVFEGVIGGSPCQDFSRARRSPPTGKGVRALSQFARVVTEAGPDWWLLENVPGVPDVAIAGYVVQRFNLRGDDCGIRQRRLRTFQFGSRDGVPLVIQRRNTVSGSSQPCAMATEGTKQDRRSFADFCELQGLPRSFDLPRLSQAAKYCAVGNGVPIPMARVVAASIRDRRVTPGQRLCVCECGRLVSGKQRMATAGCRKRMERKRRDPARVTVPGSVTPAASRSQSIAS